MSRNRYLTAGMERVLREMRDQDEELVYEPKAGWWVGLRRTGGKVALQLLRLCLLHGENFEGGVFERYSLNEEALKILADDFYIPLIIRHGMGPGVGLVGGDVHCRRKR